MKIKNKVYCFVLLFIFLIGNLIGCNKEKYTTFYNQICNKSPINMLVCGDSIGGNTESTDWCVLLADKIQSVYSSNVNLTNISMGGTNTFCGYSRIQALPEQEKYDLIIFCYGQNDEDNANFAINYEAMLSAAIHKYPNSQFLCILQSSQKTYTNKINTIIELCDYYSIPYADTITAFKDSMKEYEELSDDGIHPNEYGKQIYANEIFKVINECIINKQKNKFPSKYLHNECKKYENFCYINVSNMIKQGNVYNIEIPDQFNIIGLDQTMIPGIHSGTLTIKYENSIPNEYNLDYKWNNGSRQRHINFIDTKEFYPGIIEIKIDEEIIDSINGLIITGNNQLSIKSDTIAPQSISVSEASLPIYKKIENSVINSTGDIQTAAAENDTLKNYGVYIYEVNDTMVINCSSLTIGTPDTITRYLFSSDELAEEIIKLGATNNGGWNDNYHVTMQVPTNSKFLLVTSQNGTPPTVKMSDQDKLYEELRYEDIHYGVIMNPNGDFTESINYSVYVYNIQGAKRVKLSSNTIGNKDTILRYSYRDLNKNTAKRGSTNVNGWQDSYEIESVIPNDSAYLYVTSQNGSIPSVVIIE